MKIPVFINGEEVLFTDKEFQFAKYYLGEARFNATGAAGYKENVARQLI
jgi:hypothetical protein